MDVVAKLRELGYKTIHEDWYDLIADWQGWYTGDDNGFRSYTVWNGLNNVKCTRYSLGMAKKVCEDWANLLMNEKVTITLEGDKEQDFIDAVFDENDFEVSMNELQERGAAAGTYAIIPRVVHAAVNSQGVIVGGGNIALDYVTGENIFPLSWVGRKITECAFASVFNAEGSEYLYLQLHVLENGKYTIRNLIYETTDGMSKEVSFADVKGLESVPDEPILTGSEKPQFVIGRYNIVNNLDDNNPMGIAVFANAIDQIKGVDIAYDSYVNEFLLGKKRVMVKPSATKNLDGENVFDPSDVVFYVLPEDVSDGALIHPIDMPLRTSEHSQGLQEQLNQLSSKCGFGTNHYQFDRGSVSTATQIISENSDMFRTVKKHEIVLESLLTELCRILLRLGNTYMSAGLDEDVEISIDFDDSIIEDKAVDEARIYRMLQAGLMKPEEARALLMNEDEETAKAALPTMADLLIQEDKRAEVE
ncbi:MAG: phage portal protein [Clostridia bacterium]|nr:phage portal protein [Clostridia bacterium]